MAIEIVDLPIKDGESARSLTNVAGKKSMARMRRAIGASAPI
jgi:hypothetical protein